MTNGSVKNTASESVDPDSLGPKYSQHDLIEIEAGQGALLFGGASDDPYVVISEATSPQTQEDCALVLWALHNPEVRNLFRAQLAIS